MDSHSPSKAGVDRAQILKAAGSLGILGNSPHSAPRIMAALCNPNVVADEVAELLRREPALYARVLRVANSPYYGQTRSITTLDRAVVILGLDAVRGIAAAACLDRTVPRGNQYMLVDLRSLVQHSLATAAAAESLAKIRHPALAAEAFIAGLLHNLGIVVQMTLDAPGVQAIISLREANDHRDMRTLEAERAAVGHEECIGIIFEAWQLPEPLTAAVRNHHDPMAADRNNRELAALINLGATLSVASGSTFSLEPTPAARNPAAMAYLGVEDTDLDGIAAGLPARVAELKKALLDA